LETPMTAMRCGLNIFCNVLTAMVCKLKKYYKMFKVKTLYMPKD